MSLILAYRALDFALILSDGRQSVYDYIDGEWKPRSGVNPLRRLNMNLVLGVQTDNQQIFQDLLECRVADPDELTFGSCLLQFPEILRGVKSNDFLQICLLGWDSDADEFRTACFRSDDNFEAREVDSLAIFEPAEVMGAIESFEPGGIADVGPNASEDGIFEWFSQMIQHVNETAPEFVSSEVFFEKIEHCFPHP
jgi:hypothetical protein